MKKYIKRLVVVVLFIMTTINVSVIQGANDQENLNLEYDGQRINYKQQRLDVKINDKIVKTGDMPGIILDSRTLVPVREIFESEAIGAVVEWNGELEEIYIKYMNQSITLHINSTNVRVNGEDFLLDVPAKLIKDTDKNISKTMIPLRFVAEQLGYIVNWDSDNFIVNLYSEDKSESIDNIESEDKSESEDKPESIDKIENKDNIESKDEIENNIQVEENAGDLVLKGNLEVYNMEGWVEPVVDNTVVQTSLFGQTMKVLADSDQRELLIKNRVVNNIISNESDPVEIYNMVFNYENTKPENITLEISADGPISEVMTSLEGNTLELYILKATLDMTTTSFEYDNSDFIDALSITEYTGGQTGNQNCLIKFDLNSEGSLYNLRTNDLRTKIFVDVIMNHVEDIVIGQNEIGDYIDLQGLATDQIKVYRENARTMSFDIMNATSLMTRKIENIDGQYISALSIWQKDEITTNITLDLKGAPQYEITSPVSKVTRIQFMNAKQEKLAYSVGDSTSFVLKELANIEEIYSNTQGIDDYVNKQFQVIIPGNHMPVVATDFIEVNNAGIDDLQFSLTQEGNTKIVIRTNKIQGVSMAKYGNQLVFETHDPKELYGQVIVIDPGHGGRKPGTSSQGYIEKNINLEIALKLKTLLDENKDVKAYYTRVDDSDIDLSERANLANAVDADLFLSLHSNSYGELKTGAVSLYMDRVTNRNISSYELAKQIHYDYVANTLFVDKVITERDNLYVLKYTKMPAALLEMGYMSNDADLKLLLDEGHQKLMAQGIYNGIINVFKSVTD